MLDWNQRAYFAALDWAKDHHDVVVVDRQGGVVASFRCPPRSDKTPFRPRENTTLPPPIFDILVVFCAHRRTNRHVRLSKPAFDRQIRRP